MTNYNHGDLIEATKGEDVVRGRVEGPESEARIGFARVRLDYLMGNDFTIETIEAAIPPLPTKTGSVFTITGNSGAIYLFWRSWDSWDALNPRGESETRIEDPIAWLRKNGEQSLSNFTIYEPVSA